MNFEQFVVFYKKYGYCINDASKTPRKNPLNEIQLASRFKKYEASELKRKQRCEKQREKSQAKKLESLKSRSYIDLEWEKVRAEVYVRDNGRCRLIECLDFDEFQELKQNSGGLHKGVDPAHVLRRSEAPSLIYNKDNVALLNRFSHSCLDQFRNPINGKPIKKEEYVYWWKRIIGEDLYKKLLDKAKKERM